MVSTGQDLNGHNMFNYCSNNTINKIDVEGFLWGRLLGGIIVGGVVGYISGAAKGKKGKELLAYTLNGSITGGISAVTNPANFVEFAMVGVSESLSTQVVDGVVLNEGFDFGEFVSDTIISTGTGVLSDKVSGNKVRGAKPKKFKTDLTGKHAQKTYLDYTISGVSNELATLYNSSGSYNLKKYNYMNTQIEMMKMMNNKNKKKNKKKAYPVGLTCPNKTVFPVLFKGKLNVNSFNIFLK